jgi:DNA-binding transcriptional ArsR family regulator
MEQQLIDQTFFALSHPVRRAVLERIVGHDLSVADAAAPFEVTPSQMTKHLHILERAGLLSREKQGRVHKLHFEPDGMREVSDWVQHHQKFWQGRLDALGDYLDRTEQRDE